MQIIVYIFSTNFKLVSKMNFAILNNGTVSTFSNNIIAFPSSTNDQYVLTRERVWMPLNGSQEEGTTEEIIYEGGNIEQGVDTADIDYEGGEVN